MIKKTKIGLGILFVFLLFIFATGCDLTKRDKGSEASTDFKRGSSGLVMEFVKNYPGDHYIVSEGVEEKIFVMIDLKNKGTYPESGEFKSGQIHISGFDGRIIKIGEKSKNLDDEDMFLQAASPINPLGGFDTAEFEGVIDAIEIKIDEYNPTIMATACYPYATKASPTVCIDPLPFDDRQEKVCNIGSQTLETQGAPVAVTRIDQEASTDKIQFKITIENVGGGDVLKPDDTLEKCSPFGKKAGEKIETLGRKDFDRVQLEEIEIAGENLLSKCSPFADGTGETDTKLIRLFNGEGFVICTYDVPKDVSSAYTTPLNIKLGYNYRSTISKSIRISKLRGVS